MTRVGNGGHPPKDPDPLGRAAGVDRAPDPRGKEGARTRHEATTAEKVPPKVVDSFERAVPQLEKQIQAFAGRALAGPLRFSSEQLAQLVSAFATVLKRCPGADRRERARLFTRTVLKHERIGKLLESAGESDLERMFDAIAAQLEGSPVFAQLVDDVTEGVRATGLG